MMKKFFAALLIAGVLAGCSSAPPLEQEGAKVEDRLPQPPAKAPPSGKPGADSGISSKPLGGSAVGGDPLKDPGNILSKRSIYFDLDSNAVKEEFKPVVAAHAKYLSQNRSKKMRIEGNADERGSSEYNLALGQRRADAVRQMMQLLGATPDQIETVSFGKEKPKAPGHDEAAWAENRRADIRYQGE
jgi:peptidoglycan-associated lipoprotein